MKIQYFLRLFTMVFSMTLLFPLPVSFATEQAPLLDYGNIFTATEQNTLENTLQSLAETWGYGVGIVTYDEALPSPLLTWVKNQIGSTYFGENRVIFAFNLHSRELILEVHGTVQHLIPTETSDRMIVQVTQTFTDGNYFSGSLAMLEEVEQVLGGRQGSTLYSSIQKDSGSSSLIWISCSVGILVAAAVTWGFIYSMNTVRSQDTAKEYFDTSQFRVTQEKERFLYRTVVSLPRQSQSRGGSGRR